MSDTLPSKTLSIPDGELWSLVRSLISQGTYIQMDASAGKYQTSEEVFARIDEAAREKADEIEAKYSSHEPADDLYALLVRRGYAQHEAHAIAFGDKLAVLSSSQPPGAEHPFHAEGMPWDLVAHLYRQRAFSEKTFGPGVRTAGVCDHIRKELKEIEAAPHDLTEWVDVILLALDGAWRAGYLPGEIVAAMEAKQTKNEGRKWPDWRTAEPGKAIEHDRASETKSGDAA